MNILYMCHLLEFIYNVYADFKLQYNHNKFILKFSSI